MDAKLIAAAAKLCGWAREEWDGEDNEQCWAAVWPIKYGHRTDSPPFLTDAGLLALIKRLAECGWRYQMVGDEGGSLSLHGWSQRYFDSEGHTLSRYKVDNDFATAACMAAQVEVGDES